MMKLRGLFLLGMPILAALGLYWAAQAVRPPEDPVVLRKRVVRVVDGEETVEFVPVAQAPARRSPSASKQAGGVRAAKAPVELDIAAAAENARIQSTYQNYRTAVMTENAELQKTLLEVLRRDGAAARDCAREDSELAETPSDRAFALKALSELSR